MYVMVENRFNESVERVRVNAILPDGWEANPTSVELSRIPAQGAKLGTFEIRIPQNAESGIYAVVVSAESSKSEVLGSIAIPVKEEPTLPSLVSSFFITPVGIGLWFGIIATIVGSYFKFLFDRRSLRQTYKDAIAKGMTEKVLNNLEKYYQHLWAAMASLADYLGDYLGAQTEDNARSAFYTFCIRASFWKKVGTLSVIFVMKDRDAENELEGLDKKIDKEFSSRMGLTREEERVIVKTVEYTFSSEQFLEKLDLSSELAAIYDKFKTWLDNHRESVKKVELLARQYSQIFETQVTKIYQPWYDA